MPLPRRTLLAAPACLGAAARAQDRPTWPAREIQLVVPFAAGGATDVPARIVAQALGQRLGQTVVVVNRTGSGSLIGTDAVAKAPKDGYTLLYTSVGHAALRALYPRGGVDPVADFAPVALVGTIPLLMAVTRDLPPRDLPGLVAFLRANPGRYDYASSGNGGSVHLATELFRRQYGLEIGHIPYRGGAAAMPDLLAGRVALMFDVASGPVPEAAGRGEVRALGLTGDRRMARLPDVPTFAEAGLAGFDAETWHMILAPAGTPEPVVARLDAALHAVLADAEVIRRLEDLAIKVAAGGTPATATAFLRAEYDRWDRLAREIGIRPD